MVGKGLITRGFVLGTRGNGFAGWSQFGCGRVPERSIPTIPAIMHTYAQHVGDRLDGEEGRGSWTVDVGWVGVG